MSTFTNYWSTGSNPTLITLFTGSLISSGSITLTGSLSVSNTVTAATFSGNGALLTNIAASALPSSISASFSGSFEGDGSGLTGVVSASYALTSSITLKFDGGLF